MVPYIDFHADTITELEVQETLELNRKMVSLGRLEEANCKVQFFSAYVNTGSYPEETRDQDAWKEYQRILGRYKDALKAHPEKLLGIRTQKDLEECFAGNKIGTVFTIEDGGVLGGSMKKLEQVHEDGVRLITLTWNHENAIAYPNSQDPEVMRKGLKPFGFDVLEAMAEKNMIVDVSHLSDGGFWDVSRHYKGVFVASHSNSRAMQNHQRNLTDEMIREIANHGGIIGLNLFGPFLAGDEVSRVSDMVRHVKHIYRTGGEEVLAIGSDFDGIHGELEIDEPVKLHKLYQALEQEGFTSSILEKMWYQNGLRVLKQIK
ncbi:MAG: membrane dipeptidase [Eubacteriales bacterium]|nr:membrane dipeptidase [Eubacteriales bacterium]